MLMKNSGVPSNPKLITLLLPLFVILFAVISCAPPSIDNWVQHDNTDVDNPAMIYYVLEAKDKDGKSIGSSSTDSTDDCRLLPLDRYETMDPHGNNHYKARTADKTIWDRCWDYYNTDKPPLVINSIPKEFAEQMSIEIPEFIFD